MRLQLIRSGKANADHAEATVTTDTSLVKILDAIRVLSPENVVRGVQGFHQGSISGHL